MNTSKALLAGLAGGVLLWLYNFVMHGMIMADVYVNNAAVFRQDAANPLWFLVVEVGMAVAGAFLFAKTRSSWADGLKGGMTFGLMVGAIAFFAGFINPLVIADFPYYLAWCWGGIVVIGWALYGALIGVVYK